jgi:hypothetical protein
MPDACRGTAVCMHGAAAAAAAAAGGGCAHASLTATGGHESAWMTA